MTVDPRSLAVERDRWLTDSRLYSVIWMGRWIERAENLARTIDSAAIAATKSSDPGEFNQSLIAIASAWGLNPSESKEILADLIWKNPASSIHGSLQRARENATQVAPLELVRPLNELVIKLEQIPSVDLSPATIHNSMTIVIEGLSGVSKVIETVWFRREPLTEDELFHRFVQQQ